MSVNTDLMKTHSASGWRRLVVIVVSGLLLSASVLSAQEQGASASGVRTDTVSLWRFSGSIILDPTTYAPALTLYEAARLDWASSQVFFRNGFVELNGRFTVSGRPGDAPVSYRVGHRRIVGDAFTIMQGSVAHNVTAQVIERLLIARYPRHRKLVRVMAGWSACRLPRCDRTACQLGTSASRRQTSSAPLNWASNEDPAGVRRRRRAVCMELDGA
jgi:hypothetical protein